MKRGSAGLFERIFDEGQTIFFRLGYGKVALRLQHESCIRQSLLQFFEFPQITAGKQGYVVAACHRLTFPFVSRAGF